MYYGILDQDLNQLRMGFASADPSKLANEVRILPSWLMTSPFIYWK